MKTWLSQINRVDVLPRPAGIDLRYSEWTCSPDSKLFKKFIKTLVWEDFALYPDTNILKNRLAEDHLVSANQIYINAGSAECISNVFACFEQGQTVVTVHPNFPMYDVYALQNKLDIHKVGPRKDLTYNVDKIQGGDLIIISPPTLTGYLFSREDIITILNNNPDSWVLIDEAYVGYISIPDDITDLIHLFPNLIISRSFSKVYGAAGARVGYLISDSKNIDIISKLRPMYEISGPSLRYVMFMLDNQNIADKYCRQTIKEKIKLYKFCKTILLKTIPSEGNWIHIEQKEWFVQYLIKKNIHVKTNITIPGTKGLWIRITVGPGVTKLIKKVQ